MSDAQIAVATEESVELVAGQKFTFRFKKDKLGNKRQNLELVLPVPTGAGIRQILKTGGNERALLDDAIYSVVKSIAGDIVSDNLEISQENFPIEKVLWEAIANMPKAERATISSEQWDAFAADYMAVMPALTGKSTDQVGLAVQIFLKKFVMVKTNKKILGKLKEQLALYSDTPKAEDFQDVLELLTRRVDAYLAAEDIVISADLL